MPKPILTALPLLLLLPACSNYDFARARLPNGEWDYQQLMFDLSIARMHKQTALVSWVWIPFIYYDATVFSASKDLPFAGNGLDGYQAISHTGVGPLFCVQWTSERSITKDATFVESRDQTSVGWLLYQAKHGRVATPFGDRLTDGHKVLGIGPVSTVYEPKEIPAKQAAGRSETEKAK